MTDNIIPFDGSTKLNISFEEVAEEAKKAIQQGIIIGWDKDGMLYFTSSVSDGAEINWLIDKAKQVLLDINVD